MTIWTFEDVTALTLSSAEEKLIKNCRAGVSTKLEDRTLPAGPGDARSIRADLLRYLICGGCAECPVRGWGLSLSGAYVTGSLDLSFARAKGMTGLIGCRFEHPIIALQTRFELLTLTGSHLPGLTAQGLKVTGGVFLSGVTAEGGVSLPGARIGGQLACEDARFLNAKGVALTAQGAQVTGGVFLRKVTAEGQVSLYGARIGGQLACEDAQFSNAKGVALNAQQMNVDQFFWRAVKEARGTVNLSGAQVADLVDDAASWALVKKLHLNGLRYERFHGPMTARMRLDWVAKDAKTIGEFRPQPYEQLAQVFKAMGHTSDARKVQLKKEIRLAADWLQRRQAEQKALREKRDGKPTPKDHHEIRNRLSRIGLELRLLPMWHAILRSLIGYGYAPQRALYWAIGTITVAGLFYLWVWNFGGMVPNSDVVLTSAQWHDVLAAHPDYPAAAWEVSEAGQHYETFAAGTYAADVFIPLIDLGQESAWTATTTTRWGMLAWILTWFLKGFGWFVTALGAAAITGIIRRE